MSHVMDELQETPHYPLPISEYFEKLHQAIKGPRQSLLMVNYNGILASLSKEPDQTRNTTAFKLMLERAELKVGSRIILFSGRQIRDVLPLLDLNPIPEIWGSHGTERRYPDGEYEVGPFEPAKIRGLANADEYAADHGVEEYCEQKPGVLSLHWKGLKSSKAERIRAWAQKKWHFLAKKWNLEIGPLDGGIELRVPGHNKGQAVKTILSEISASTAIAYLGADHSDENAFSSLGDQGLTILNCREPRPSKARFQICHPKELHQFLDIWSGSQT